MLIESNFVILGKAVKQTTDGECEERSYTNGVLDGEATVIFPDGSKEIRTYRVFKGHFILRIYFFFQFEKRNINDMLFSLG